MITQEYRPCTFKDVAGQDLVKRVLKSVVKHPDTSPRSIILQGEWGTGKTSQARILARALNCSSHSGDACMKCDSCREDLDSSPYYLEYDSSVVGNVDKIRELRDTFYYHVSGGYRVVLMDEIQNASRQAQSALLKVIEEVPDGVFFVFATTDIDRLLPTIRSRSLELRLQLVSEDDIISNLKSVSVKMGKELNDDIAKLIAQRSRGHMRDAHMLLDQFFMIGEEDFRISVRSSRDYFLSYFESFVSKSKDNLFKSIKDLLTFPLADLKVDFQKIILEMVTSLVNKSGDSRVLKLVQSLGANVLKIVKISASEWVLSSFDSDVAFQACLLCIYQMMSNVSGKRVSENTLMSRAMKR